MAVLDPGRERQLYCAFSWFCCCCCGGAWPNKPPNQLPLFAAFLAFIASSSFCTRRSGRIPLPVMTPVLDSLLPSCRGGLGVSTWLAEEDSVLASTSLSSGIGPWPEGTLETGLLVPGPVLTGRPKKELRGETMPGDTGLGVPAGEGRYMLLTTTLAAPGTSEVERRWWW
jgi:hypothetical protein